MDSQGGRYKKMENSREIIVNLTGNPGGQLQKNRYPRQGSIISFWKSPSLSILVLFQIVYHYTKKCYKDIK